MKIQTKLYNVQSEEIEKKLYKLLSLNFQKKALKPFFFKGFLFYQILNFGPLMFNFSQTTKKKFAKLKTNLIPRFF